MISKNRLKFIKSLQIKKFRKAHRLFLVEGAKNIEETLRSDYRVDTLLITSEYANCWQKEISNKHIQPEIVTEEDLEKAGTLQTNNAGLAIVEMKEDSVVSPGKNEYILALDDIRDPGNLGTIIRIADWYGIRNIACSLQTAEFHNPKVISATMGSFTRINCFYCDLAEYIKSSGTGAIYGAFLEGRSVHNLSFSPEGLIVLGNESSGISKEIEELVKEKITIPKFGGAESLNVAIATSIICDNMRRATSL